MRYCSVVLLVVALVLIAGGASMESSAADPRWEDWGVTLSYDCDTIRDLAYEFRLHSIQEGRDRDTCETVQDLRFDLTLHYLGEGRIKCRAAGFRDLAIDDYILKEEMACSTEITVSPTGTITAVGDPQCERVEDLDDADAETARFLLRSHLTNALDHLFIHLPGYPRGPGLSWSNPRHEWPFRIAKDVGCAFRLLRLDSVPKEANGEYEITGHLEETHWGNDLTDLPSSHRQFRGRFHFDPTSGAITQVKVRSTLEMNWTRPRDEGVVPVFGIKDYEIRLTG